MKDIKGEVPKAIHDVINYLKEKKIRGKEKNLLLYGPPGTGKTSLADAIAGEVRGTFLHTTASSFIDIYQGSGSGNVKKLFNEARDCALLGPVIVFIDEIEVLAAKRNNNGNGERCETLNTLNCEISSIADNKNIVVIAATNNKDNIDLAFRRSGRFLPVEISLPNEKSRYEILLYYLTKHKHKVSDNVLLDVAKNSKDFNGADLKTVVDYAADYAVERDDPFIRKYDIDEAFERAKKRHDEYVTWNSKQKNFFGKIVTSIFSGAIGGVSQGIAKIIIDNLLG